MAVLPSNAALRVLLLPSECCCCPQSAAALRVLLLPSECCCCPQSAAAALRVLLLPSEFCCCPQSAAAALRVLLLPSEYYPHHDIIYFPCPKQMYSLTHSHTHTQTQTHTLSQAYSNSLSVSNIERDPEVYLLGHLPVLLKSVFNMCSIRPLSASKHIRLLDALCW